MKRLTVRVLAASLAAAGAVAVVGGSASADRAPRHHYSAVAQAIPSAPGANADDQATRIDAAYAHQLRLDGVATASLTCDGCTGHAVTLQVVYARHTGRFTADNVATAWAADCTTCRGWALSLQIVIAPRAHDVTVANRALAVNATCTNCSVAAAAIQIVVATRTHRPLSPAAIGQIEAMRDQLVAQLSAESPATAAPLRAAAVPERNAPQARPVPAPDITATTATLQSIVARDLRATSATNSVQVQVS